MTTDKTMRGKLTVVTGGNTGIGIWTVIGLAKQGAHVIMVARSQQRGEEALRLAREAAGSDDITLMIADLASLASIRAFAAAFKAQFSQLDVLINNAAVIPDQRRVTADGLEEQFQVNHLAPFYLTHLLLDALRASGKSRIVNVSSQLHTNGELHWDDLQSEIQYSGWQVYCNTKLYNILFTYELARRLQGTDITANVLHPGVIETNLSREIRRGSYGGYVTLNPAAERGAATSLYLATASEVEGVTGKYFDNLREKQSSPRSHDEEVARRLWSSSAALVGVNV
jgi:NAD(P)-dependent dehydrogenase (short-subunit alcohol dehydrogenase family)